MARHHRVTGGRGRLMRATITLGMAGGTMLGACAALAGSAAVIEISKELSSPPFYLAPGGVPNFSVTVTNSGLASPVGARLLDPEPLGLFGQDWTCTAFGGAMCATPLGGGPIDESLDGLVPGGSLQYSVSGQGEPVPPPYVTNVAEVTLAFPDRCNGGATPPCRALVSMPTGANLEVSLQGALVVGGPGSVQYVLVASNSPGASSAAGTLIRNPVPDGLTGYGWTCVGNDGAVCPAAAGSGAIEQTVATWPGGGSLTYTIDATIGVTPPTNIAGTALLIPPYGGSCGFFAETPPCIASTSLSLVPRIDVSKIAEAAGPFITYSINVENRGADAPNTVISDPVPAGVTDFLWSCSGFDGALCPVASGAGALNEIVTTLPTGGRLNYLIDAALDPVPPQIVSNTVSVTPAGGVCGDLGSPPPCLASADVSLFGGVISVSKSANPSDSVAPGGSVEYTINISNVGTSVISPGLVLVDAVPAGIAGFDSWTCEGQSGIPCPQPGGSGAINTVLGEIPPLESIIVTINATVTANPPLEIVNLASVDAPGGGVGCSGFGQPVSPPCAAQTTLLTAPILQLFKSADGTEFGPGGTVNYTLEIFNIGVDAAAVQIEDPLPAGIDSATWSCIGFGTVACPTPSGSGAISDVVDFPGGFGNGLIYEIAAAVGTAAPPSITNTLTVTPPAGGFCASPDFTFTPPPCVAEVTTSSVPLIAVEKTADRPQLLLGGSVAYDVIVRNLGGIGSGTQFSDALPTGLDRMDWTCSGFGGAACPAFSGSGSINATIGAFPSNAHLRYRIDGVVGQGAPASITNVASVTPPPGGACADPSCSASSTLPVTLTPSANLGVTIAADAQTAPPGGTVNYVVEVTNSGLVEAGTLLVDVPVAAGLAAVSWTCEGTECPAPAGSGAIAQAIPSMGVFDIDAPFGAGRIVYAINATVTAAPPPIINTIATITPSGSATCDGAVCTATSSLPTGFVGAPVIGVTKTANLAELSAGAPVQYTVGISNSGGADAGQTVLVDAVPPGITSFAWTCAQTGGAVCPATTGAGALNQTIAAIPVGASLVYTINAQVSPNPPASISNSAVVTPPGGATCLPASCVATLTLPVATQVVPLPEVVVNKRFDGTAGVLLLPGQAVAWTITASNTGAATGATLTLVDSLPANIRDVRVLPDAGVACDALTPPAGAEVTCTIAAGFSGVRRIGISAVVVGADGQGGVRNSVSASGADAPVCAGCVAVNPVGVGADVALGNPRAFSAAGIAGTLFDVVNLSATTASAVDVTLSPGSAIRLFATFASGCTASAGGVPGSVVVTCPSPPSQQGVSCSADRCTVASLGQGAAVTLFAALNPGAGPAFARVEVEGDPDVSNNELALPQEGSP